jgi:hypothetical protein
MRTIYIDSYYHSQTYQKYLKSETTSDVRDIINGITNSNGKLCISYLNLHLVERLGAHPLQPDEARYITALYSDLEVAIQEKKLFNLGTKFKFDVVLKRSNDIPDLDYLEEYPVDDIDLEEEEIITGNLYVINTHGRAQVIDGPYYQAIYNTLNPQRILVDACSSASRGFPMKKSGNNSAVELVADECIKARKDKQLEIVGYKHRYDTTASMLSARAAFASRKTIVQESDLTLITLEDRKKQLVQIKEQQQIKAQEKKRYDFEKATVNCTVNEALKRCLIDVSSKLLVKFLYIKTQPSLVIDASILEKAINLIANMTLDVPITLDLINKVINKNFKKTSEDIKIRKKTYITSLGDEQTLELAKETYEFCKIPYLTISDGDFHTSINLLESLIEKHDSKRDAEPSAGHLERWRADGGANNYTPAFFSTEKMLDVAAKSGAGQALGLASSGVAFRHSDCGSMLK